MQLPKKNRQWIAAMTSFALIVLAIVGLILTRDSTAPGERTRTRRPPLVDEKPMQTNSSLRRFRWIVLSVANDRVADR